MNKFIICYDLHSDEPNYEGLIEEIEKYPESVKINQSVWVICSLGSADSICKRLRSTMSQDDNIFVSELGDDRQWWLPKNVSEKLKRM